MSGRSGAVLPVSIVVPTIGRPQLLEQCLRSILACEPGPAEVVVGDQSGDVHIAALMGDLGDARLVRVACDGTGASRARNAALRAASHDVVMLTDDDCRVGSEWVAPGGRISPRARARSSPAGCCLGRTTARPYRRR